MSSIKYKQTASQVNLITPRQNCLLYTNVIHINLRANINIAAATPSRRQIHLDFHKYYLLFFLNNLPNYIRYRFRYMRFKKEYKYSGPELKRPLRPENIFEG